MPGLSRLQRRILTILPPSDVTFAQAATPSEIIEALGLDRRKPSVRVNVSRSLNRLCTRGLVDAWQGMVQRQGKGSKYLLAEPKSGS